MRKSRRLVIPLAVFSLIAAAGITVGLTLVANAANQLAICPAQGTKTTISCSITDTTGSLTVNDPSSLQAVVTLGSGDGSSPSDQAVLITYSVTCTQGTDTTVTTQPTDNEPQAISTSAAVTDTLTLGYTNPDSCDVTSLKAELEAASGSTLTPITTGQFTLQLEWTPANSASTASSSTSSTHVSTISGYDGKCMDDKGNSSAKRTEIIIWTCNSSDSAQGWTFSDNELKHNGDCANIQGNGGSGSKLILWSCNGAENEKWFHSTSDGEYVSAGSSHGLICVDDPGYSKTNRTQLIVYTCHNGSNQHWSS
jgi:hypothetical protein